MRTCIRSNTDVPLLNKSDGLLEGLRHLQADHDDGQPPPTEAGSAQPLQLFQALPCGDDPHVMQLVQQFLRKVDAGRVGRAQLLDDCCQGGDLTNQLVVLLVVIAVLDMVPPHHLHIRTL